MPPKPRPKGSAAASAASSTAASAPMKAPDSSQLLPSKEQTQFKQILVSERSTAVQCSAV